MFRLEDTGITALSDTLATVNLEPAFFTTKCFPLPHLGMVVAHTGLALVGHRWVHLLNTQVLARGIDQLDWLVPSTLQRIQAEVFAELGPSAHTTTIYHLGFSETYQKCVGFAYRSTANFASEVMGPSFRIKPEPVGEFEAPRTVDEMVQLGRRVRTEQDALPADKRMFIGGELVVAAVVDRAIATQTVFRFEDYEAQWLAMNERIRRATPGSSDSAEVS
jgi:hypothetical protein